jgi:hypothetical protein
MRKFCFESRIKVIVYFKEVIECSHLAAVKALLECLFYLFGIHQFG